MSTSKSKERDSATSHSDPSAVPLPVSPPIEPHAEPSHAEPETLESMLEEAIDTRLASDQITPIAPLPRAHHPSTMSSTLRPRLLTQISRSTMPVSSMSYAQATESLVEYRSPYTYTYPHAESSAAARRRASASGVGFPDLDPSTGLPLTVGGADGLEAGAEGAVAGPEGMGANGLQLQRTITGLLKSPTQRIPSVPFPTLGIPKMPSLPAMPNMPNVPGINTNWQSRRSMSSSSSQSDWGWGWWSGNKSKVDRMMSEEDQAETVSEEREKHKRKYRTPKHPMVFCHGLLGFDYLGPTSLPPLQISHWRGIREVLESNGVDVLITRVPATASVADRAAILAETIAEKYEGQQVNLIGHSMGGLDCRYLISELKPTKFKIVSVTTISTPHRGSPFADYLIDNIVGRERLPSLLGVLESLSLPQSGDGSAFESLGTRAMKAFNAQIVDDPDVKYYSWGASFEPGLLDTFKWPHSVILAKEGPNDGLVSVQSAKWGEYRGTLLDVNHLDLVGWVNHVRYAFAGWAGKPITFKPATFYLEISDYLAEQGF